MESSEMQQLVSMGFSDEAAAEALNASGGDLLKATDWLLNQNPPQNDTISTSTSPSPTPSPFQPKINRFFNSQSKQPKPKHSAPQAQPMKAQKENEEDDLVSVKRRKLLEESEQQPEKRAGRFRRRHQPLYERMRPRTLDEVVGQDHLLAANSMLRSAIECGRLPSLILWGPPGCGKTSIAKAIVNSVKASSRYRFVSLSAVTCGVKDVRDAVDEAKKLRNKNNVINYNYNNNSRNDNRNDSNDDCSNKGTILFIDEVHRFNKAQQDSLLPVIEDGSVVFMGATTENPSFHLITPLLSRCRVVTLNPLRPEHVAGLLKRAVSDEDKGLVCSVGEVVMGRVRVDEDAVAFLSENCDGDARVALIALEISATTAAARLGLASGCEGVPGDGDEGSSPSTVVVSIDDVKEALQCKHIAYDRAGEEHYNLISALHKSMRGSDADAAIYWLARMLEGGEEPLYIARRLIRFASEDVGLADPSALTQAVACYQACHFLGMPECNVILAQCVAYLALAPKSVAVYKALGAAERVVKESVGQNERVPLHLRNAPTKLMKDLGYGKDYIYPPDNPRLAETQTYLPPSLKGYKFLDWPTNAGSDLGSSKLWTNTFCR